jgi:hypothetical protein
MIMGSINPMDWLTVSVHVAKPSKEKLAKFSPT